MTSLLATHAFAEITKQPYLLIEEIGITQADSLEDASYEIYPTATAQDSSGNIYIAGAAQAIVSPFRFFDFSAPYTFDYGCQYSTEVCNLLWYGFEDDDGDAYEDGFMYYRERLEDQDDGDYTSQFIAFLASDDASLTPTAGNELVWSSVTEKEYIFDDDEGNDTDTRIHDLYVDSNDNVWAVGYDSSPFEDDIYTNLDSDTLYRDFIQRAFLKNITTGTVVSLVPDIFNDDDSADLSDDYGGLSAAHKIVEVDGNYYAIGQASNAFIDEDDSDEDYWEDCQYDADDYYYCSGYTTQAWAWDITDIITATDSATYDDTELSGFALADEWVDTDSDSDYDLVNRSAIAYAMNSSGVGVGYSTIDISESVTGGRAQAVTFICSDEDNNGTYGSDECDVTKIPNSASEDDYDGDNDDLIKHQWAVDINDNGLIVGNQRWGESVNSNKPVEFFLFEAATDASDDYDFTDSSGSLSWPLQNDPISGANSEIKAINSDGLAVGWRDADGEDQPAYGGTTRQQAAFLFNTTDYLNGEDDYVWYLNDLICYEEDDEATTPYYLIEYATEITDDDTIIASGYKYASQDNMDDSIDPTPVMLRLTVNSSGDITDLASCPEEETSSYDRQGAASWGLLLLLLPFGMISRFSARVTRK